MNIGTFMKVYGTNGPLLMVKRAVDPSLPFNEQVNANCVSMMEHLTEALQGLSREIRNDLP